MVARICLVDYCGGIVDIAECFPVYQIMKKLCKLLLAIICKFANSW